METLHRHRQTHNDIKPQNFLVKFNNGLNDLINIEVVLTDFGMAGSDTKGGTPIFASPECFEKKTNASDIYSLGRVVLFLILSNFQFFKWLFLPIETFGNDGIQRLISASGTDKHQGCVTENIIGILNLWYSTF